MGLSIKREQTERLARQVSELTGESLTDAIHGALEHRLAHLGRRPPDRDAERAAIDSFLKELDARPVRDDRSLREMEKDWYDNNGDPIG